MFEEFDAMSMDDAPAAADRYGDVALGVECAWPEWLSLAPITAVTPPAPREISAP